MLDLPTVLYLHAAVELAIGLTMVMVLMGKRSVAGWGEWALASLLQAAATAIFIISPKIPGTLIIGMSNLLVGAAGYSYLVGARKLARRSASRVWESALVVIACIAITLPALFEEARHLRVALASLVVVYAFACTGLIIWSMPSKGFNRERILLGVGFWAWSAIVAFRAGKLPSPRKNRLGSMESLWLLVSFGPSFATTIA